jgi:hypothetical protein
MVEMVVGQHRQIHGRHVDTHVTRIPGEGAGRTRIEQDPRTVALDVQRQAELGREIRLVLDL